jgi:hypothetical protein
MMIGVFVMADVFMMMRAFTLGGILHPRPAPSARTVFRAPLPCAAPFALPSTGAF